MIAIPLCHEVAQATGESVQTIRRLGFSLVPWPTAKTVRSLLRARRRLRKNRARPTSPATS